MTDERRLIALENGHDELRKEFATMVTNHVKLDKSLTMLITKLDTKFEEDREHDTIVKDTNSMVSQLNIRMAGGPMERHNEMERFANPIWGSVRELEKKFHIHEAKFQECSDALEKRMENRITKHLTVAVILFGLIVSITGFTYMQDRKSVDDHLDIIREGMQILDLKITDHYAITSEKKD